MTYQAPITGLHGPKLLPFLQHSTENIMLALSLKFGVHCCSFGLPHPAAQYQARVPLDLWTHLQTPPFPKYTHRGCQSAALELRIPNMNLKY